jgi:hypothetical protein
MAGHRGVLPIMEHCADTEHGRDESSVLVTCGNGVSGSCTDAGSDEIFPTIQVREVNV